MNKPRRDLKVALAGMCCGLFSASVFLLAARIERYYAYLRSYHETYQGVEDLWWVPMVTWHVVLTIAASFLMHRYLASNRVLPFLRWQAIGLVALIGWALSISIGLGLGCLIHGSTAAIENLLRSENLAFIAQFTATIFASNVLYGSAIQAASSEDIHERSPSPTVDNAI
jgi:hypothetical protein